jgi:hypothetical protein
MVYRSDNAVLKRSMTSVIRIDSQGQARRQLYGSGHALTIGRIGPLCPGLLYTNVTQCHKRVLNDGLRSPILRQECTYVYTSATLSTSY